MIVEHAALTDVGQVRSRNEDHLSCAPDIGLYIVADGMGGHRGGDEASRHACAAVEEHVRQRLPVLQAYVREPSPQRRGHVVQVVTGAARAANDRIVLEADQNPDVTGMGSTVVFLLLIADRAFVGHVGDSRAYLLRDGVATLLTEDHSLLFELVRSGRIPKSAAARFPLKNVVTRALGVRGVVDADCQDLDVLPGDRFLLCSDGLHGYTDDDLLHGMAGTGSLTGAVERMVAFANASGGSDNISALLVEVRALEGEALAARERVRRGRTMPIFTPLTLGEWLRVVSLCEHKRLGAGEELFRAGGTGEGLYGILSGTVAVVRDGQVVQRFGPGSHFGEMSLLEERPRLVSAVADTPCELILLTRKTFDGMMSSSPGLAARMLRQLVLILAKRLVSTNDELVVLRTVLDAADFAPPTVLSSDALEDLSGEKRVEDLR